MSRPAGIQHPVVATGHGRSVVLQVLGSNAPGCVAVRNSPSTSVLSDPKDRYRYKIKIINPQKKSDVVVRQLPNLHAKFESIVILRAKLIEKLGEQVPNTATFDVGYYEGQRHSKIWLCSNSDLEAMYHKHPTGEITLWCDGRIPGTEEEVMGRSKRRRDDPATGSSKRQKKEEEVDSIFKELKEKHGNKFDTPRLRLWARMLANDIHDDFENPPSVPVFCSTPKRPRQELISCASGAAIAFAKALGETPKGDGESRSTLSCTPTGVSPGKAIELRMKNYEQLRYIQQLFDDSILSETEYNYTLSRNKVFLAL